MINDTSAVRNPIPDGYMPVGANNLIEAAKKAAADKKAAGTIRMYSEEYPDWDKPIPAHIPVGDPNDKRTSLEAMREIYFNDLEKQAAEKAATNQLDVKEKNMTNEITTNADNTKTMALFQRKQVAVESPIVLVSRAIDTVTGMDGKVVEGVTQEVTIIDQPEEVVSVFEALNLEEEIAVENLQQEEIPAFLLKPEKEQTVNIRITDADKILAETDADFASVLEQEEMYAAQVPKVKGKLQAQVENKAKTVQAWFKKTTALVIPTPIGTSPQMALLRVKRAFGQMHEHLDAAKIVVDTRFIPLFNN